MISPPFYRLTVTYVEPIPTEEMEKMRRLSSGYPSPVIVDERETRRIETEVTREQYEKIKKALLEVWG